MRSVLYPVTKLEIEMYLHGVVEDLQDLEIWVRNCYMQGISPSSMWETFPEMMHTRDFLCEQWKLWKYGE